MIIELFGTPRSSILTDHFGVDVLLEAGPYLRVAFHNAVLVAVSLTHLHLMRPDGAR